MLDEEKGRHVRRPFFLDFNFDSRWTGQVLNLRLQARCGPIATVLHYTTGPKRQLL